MLCFISQRTGRKICWNWQRMKSEDLVYGKHNFNRYGMIISFISNFLTEVTDEMYKMLNEFNNEISGLKMKRLVVDDLLVYKNELKYFKNVLKYYILKNKQRTPTKWISAEKLFKPGSSSSPLSIRFQSQEIIAERVKPQERKKKTGTGLKISTPNKIFTRHPTLLAQVTAGSNSGKYYIFCMSIIKSPKKFTTI